MAQPDVGPSPSAADVPSPEGLAKPRESSGAGLPEKIGDYLVRRELGSGGSGIVYLGHDPRLDRPVAIKALNAQRASDPSWRERLAREARVLASLHHPHIALIYERLDDEDGRSYLIMEHVEGETLRDLVKRGRLPVAKVIELGGQIAGAIEAANNRGVVHRDLKPENIIVTPNNGAKVLDFGVALAKPVGEQRVLGGTMDSTIAFNRPGEHHTAAGWLIGTPGYMSPEQARGGTIDKRADVFAFGCLLYECLTGKPAFDGPSTAERIAAILKEYPDYTLLPTDTPEQLRALLPKLLEKDLTERLRDIGEAKHIFEELAGRRPSSTPMPMTVETPHNLPDSISSFVGRESFIERLRELPRQTRLLTITGPGGSGKTRLALKVAEAVLPQFPDGVWFVECKDLDSVKAIACAVATAMSAPETDVTPEKVAARLKSLRVLLVFDGCEQVTPFCKAVAEKILKNCSHVSVLCTSQRPLSSQGETIFRLPPLAVPSRREHSAEEAEQYESVRLFVQRARMARADFALTKQNVKTVSGICRRLDGMPLAIELIAPMVRVLTVSQIEDRLDAIIRPTRGSQDDDPQNSLMASLETSYTQLAPDERSVLTDLSVFSGGFTLDAAMAICGSGRSELKILRLLAGLADKSLISVEETTVPDELSASRSGPAPEPHTGAGAEPTAAAATSMRYGILEATRYLVQEKSRAVDQSGLRDRHLAYYQALVERVRPDPGRKGARWPREAEVERDNLIAAFDWAKSDGVRWKSGLRIAYYCGWYNASDPG